MHVYDIVVDKTTLHEIKETVMFFAYIKTCTYDMLNSVYIYICVCVTIYTKMVLNAQTNFEETLV